VARPPDRQGVVARVAWAAVVVVGLLMTLIATAAMANTDAAGRTKTFHDYPDDRLPSLTWAGTAQPTPDVGFVYDTNQLATLSIGTEAPATLTWDRLGNLSADATRTFAWDGENRLVGVTYLAGTYNATSFTYDGLDRRTSISLTPRGGGAPVTTRYVWCGDELCQARNATGAVTRAYYAEGESVSGSPARPLYDAPDHLGSVRRVFGKNQASAFDYDAYGNLLQSPTTVVTDFTWAGMFNEPNSGLYLTNYRPYDPVTGRFITRDPAGETADPEGNLYPYAANDPVNANDPLGLCPITDGEEPEESEVPTDETADPTLEANRARTPARSCAIHKPDDLFPPLQIRRRSTRSPMHSDELLGRDLRRIQRRL
jgi:RHS repeat-associated protein